MFDGVDAIKVLPAAQPTTGDSYLRIVFPHWAMICAFGAVPVFVGIRFGIAHRRRYKRLAVGCCPACGYDLRVTPGRCSECGWTMGPSGTSMTAVT